jgi:hypothetical protein
VVTSHRKLGLSLCFLQCDNLLSYLLLTNKSSTIAIIIAVIIRCRILKYFDSQETDHSQETDPALVIEFSVCA